MPFIILSLLIILFQWTSAAQAKNPTKVWSLLTLNKVVNNVTYQIEPQLRVRTPYPLYDSLLTNAGVGYQFTEQSAIWLGGANENIGRRLNTPAKHQYRVWEQLLNNHQTNTITLSLRSRFEQRKLETNPQWNFRLRERITATKNLTKSLALVGYDEVFINLNQPDWVEQTVIHQNRLSLGLSQQASSAVTLGAGYLAQIFFTGTSRLDHVFTFNIQYTC